MKSQGWIVFLLVAFAAGLVFAMPARAERIPRIELLREIHVARTSVLLSDFLPEGSSIPPPGNSSTIERDGIESRIGTRRSEITGIMMAVRVAVSRETRPIVLSEVFDAICKSLERSGMSEWNSLRPEDVLLQTQVLVTPGDAGLQVLRTDLDAGLRRARFLLWPSNDPKVLPFIVTARWVAGIPINAVRPEVSMSHGKYLAAAEWKPAQRPRREILVSIGERATLLLHSDVLRMIADVIPLERGALGERVRVRMADTGKIFSAEVDGRAHLDLKF